MKLSIQDVRINILGDPHLGKVFKVGVPLDRRGEREASQWEDFNNSLMGASDADVHVCMGDLFDRFIVPPETVLRVAESYKEASCKNPSTTYIILRGNHDASRDTGRKSSFDILEEILTDEAEVLVISDEARAIQWLDGTVLLFCPWHPFKTAAEIVNEEGDDPAHAAFGHWDVESFGSNDDNLIPQEVWKRTATVFTGHVHTPEKRILPDGSVLNIVGAMQPYSHSEDVEHRMYVTLTLDQLAVAGDLTNKCVRVLLNPGEELTSDVDCRQLTVKRVTGADEDPLEVKIEDFSFEQLFMESLAEAEVSKGVIDTVWARYQEIRTDA